MRLKNWSTIFRVIAACAIATLGLGAASAAHAEGQPTPITCTVDSEANTPQCDGGVTESPNDGTTGSDASITEPQVIVDPLTARPCTTTPDEDGGALVDCGNTTTSVADPNATCTFETGNSGQVKIVRCVDADGNVIVTLTTHEDKCVTFAYPDGSFDACPEGGPVPPPGHPQPTPAPGDCTENCSDSAPDCALAVDADGNPAPTCSIVLVYTMPGWWGGWDSGQCTATVYSNGTAYAYCAAMDYHFPMVTATPMCSSSGAQAADGTWTSTEICFDALTGDITSKTVNNYDSAGCLLVTDAEGNTTSDCSQPLFRALDDLTAGPDIPAGSTGDCAVCRDTHGKPTVYKATASGPGSNVKSRSGSHTKAKSHSKSARSAVKKHSTSAKSGHSATAHKASAKKAAKKAAKKTTKKAKARANKKH